GTCVGSRSLARPPSRRGTANSSGGRASCPTPAAPRCRRPEPSRAPIPSSRPTIRHPGPRGTSADRSVSDRKSFRGGLLPRARPRAGVIIKKEDYVPDLVFLQELLPCRHGGVPGPP